MLGYVCCLNLVAAVIEPSGLVPWSEFQKVDKILFQIPPKLSCHVAFESKSFVEKPSPLMQHSLGLNVLHL